ncbi:MAG: hypothetical protein ACOC3G_08340 [Phycisphaeraceae bacterium]
MNTSTPPGGDDHDRRDRDLQKKLEASKKARDIGAIPEVEDLERRTACSHSFQLFCETYFSDAFHLDWSEDHLRVLSKIESVLLEGGLFAFGMPRGSGKSTLCRAAVLFAMLYGLHRYVVLIAASGDLAQKLLRGVKRVLMANPRLGADFPEACYPLRKLENNARKQVGQLCQGEPTYITWADDELIFPTLGQDQLPESLQHLEASPSCGSIISVAGLADPPVRPLAGPDPLPPAASQRRRARHGWPHAEDLRLCALHENLRGRPRRPAARSQALARVAGGVHKDGLPIPQGRSVVGSVRRAPGPGTARRRRRRPGDGLLRTASQADGQRGEGRLGGEV